MHIAINKMIPDKYIDSKYFCNHKQTILVLSDLQNLRAVARLRRFLAFS